MKRLLYLTYICCLFSFSQAPNNGFFVNNIEKDVFKIPDSNVINNTEINSRTYETYFYANSAVARQFIFMEGDDQRGVMAYIEGGNLIVGAYNINTGDYTNIWGGTYFRKSISANTWYHVSLVFDNAPVPAPAPAPPVTENDNTSLKWYLDGVLQDSKAGFQIGGSSIHNKLLVGLKDEKLYFPICATWTASGLSEYCFGTTINEDGGDENYFDGYVWGFRVWNTVRTVTEINDNKSNLFLQTDDANLLAVLDGDTITYLDDGSLPQEIDSEKPPTVKEWEGNTDTNWANTTNWKSGLVPDNAKQEPVLIKKQSTFYPVISATVVTGDIKFEAHATEPGKITIQDGGTLDVAYDLLNDGNIIIENNGSLVVRESKPLIGVGSFNITRNTPNYPGEDFYSVWSTPVNEANSQFSTVFNNSIIIYEYDSSQNPSAYVQIGSGSNMEVGKGYFIRSDNDSGVLTRTFTGNLNNGNIDEPVNYNSPTDSANLIGNPYLSAIDWKMFYLDNNDVLQGTMYFWRQSIVGPNNSTGDYISYNWNLGSPEPLITGDIAAGQGMFVKSTAAGTVTFKNSHKVVGNNGQFFRAADSPDDGKSWFRLSGSMGYSPILIGFIPGATDDYESNYDATFINEGASIELYSLLDAGKYEIQGRSVLEENQEVEVPLGFEVTSAGDYAFSIVLEYIDTNFDILLEDTLLGITTNLRELNYTFNMSSPAEDNTRFILHYDYGAALSSDEFIEDYNSINAVFQNDELITNVNKISPETIQLFDITGKEILSEDYNSRMQTSNLSSGIYIVRYVLNDSKIISKKVVKR